MKKNVKAYCVKKINWPTKSYGVMIPLFKEAEAFWLYTAYDMLVDLKQVREIARDFRTELNEYEGGSLASGESVIIIEMELQRLYKMTPDLWKDGGIDYSDSDRNKLLMEAVKVPQFFEVLATYWGDSKTPFAIAAAFYKNHPQDIDTFMKTTNWRVETTAKTSAIYKIVRTFGYDWVNDEIINPNDTATKSIN